MTTEQSVITDLVEFITKNNLQTTIDLPTHKPIGETAAFARAMEVYNRINDPNSPRAKMESYLKKKTAESLPK